MRVALVHDWLTGMRGGEKVLAELCALFPDATVYTLVHREGATPAIEHDRRVVTSVLQRLPFGRTHHRYYLPLFPAAARSLRVEGPLDPAVLERCLGEIVRRHEALRTVFAVQGDAPAQVIQPPAPFVLPRVDLSGLPAAAREAAAHALATGI